MKNKDEEALTPDSANISDMQTNDDEDDRAESRERSRGKRRTAREIASMFEQLKQRHVARKKEWQEEKEDLIKKVQTADESKKILSELKKILENLREELKWEERKRIEMEASHTHEKISWDSEKSELLRRIEDSSLESDREGSDVVALTEKITEQTHELTVLQNDLLELKKSLLEKENSFLREKRNLELELEKERAAWKKKEASLSERIKLLDSKSGGSSTSLVSPVVSPASTPHPPENINEAKYGLNSARHRKKSSVSSAHEETSGKYNVFQKTVDDALKQIEKISEDLEQMKEPHSKENTPTQGHSRSMLRTTPSSMTPSPRRLSLTPTCSTETPDNDPSVNAPWRTKRRSNSFRQLHSDNNTNALREGKSHNISPSNDSLLVAQLKMTSDKRSPLPLRKVKKIDRQGSLVDIVVSSPDNNQSDTGRDFVPTPSGSRFPFADEASDASSPRDFIQDTAPSASNKILSNPSKTSTRLHDTGPIVQNKRPQITDKSSAYPPPEQVRKPDPALNIKSEEIAGGRSSPRLPKLHQQLLFKREFPTKSGPTDAENATKISSNTEYLSSTDKGKISEDGVKYDSPSSGTRRLSEDSYQTHTPYFKPNVEYIPGSKGAAKGREIAKIPIDEKTSIGKYQVTPRAALPGSSQKRSPGKSNIGGALVSLGTSLISANKEDVDLPPVVHPKPKVSVHKDEGGNIIRVSPEVGSRGSSRKSVSPEGNQGSEKHYSIAGRVGNVGKAGRDWIKKKLSFKDRKDEVIEMDEKNRGTPSTGDTLDDNKKRGRSKPRGRSSSLLRGGRNFGSRRSLSTAIDQQKSSSDESNESDREGKRRESFLRRNRRKAKKNAVDNMEQRGPTSAKSKPKKYTRSKTDSAADMKNFLTKFKASQSNPKKPSVVKQFERKLLENEVKTIEEIEAETKAKRQDTSSKPHITESVRHNRDRRFSPVTATRKSIDEGYTGEDEEDDDRLQNDELSTDASSKLILPTIGQGSDGSTRLTESRTSKQGPPVKAKPHYRRSMTDFNFETDMINNDTEGKRNKRMEEKVEELPKINNQQTGVREAGEVCGKKGVSDLVNRFSSITENRQDKVSEPTPVRRGSGVRHSFREQTTEYGKKSPEDHFIQRSHSMSSRDSPYGRSRKTSDTSSSAGTFDKEMNATTKSFGQQRIPKTSSYSWRDRVMSKPTDSAKPNSEKNANSSSLAPPGEHESKRISWSSDIIDSTQNSNLQSEKSPKSGRMKMMSEEMRRKANMLEKALVKGPTRIRTYKRADTQPIGSCFTDSEDEDTDSEIDFTRAFRPFMNDFKRAERRLNSRSLDEDFDKNDDMHNVIPRVTTKFDKPTRPGRLPSRWAR